MKGMARSMITRESSPRKFSVTRAPFSFQYAVPYGPLSLAGSHHVLLLLVFGRNIGSHVGTFASVEKH